MRKFTVYTDRVVPVHHSRVVVETAAAHGAPRDALFENTELSSEMLTSPDMRVSYLQYSILSSNALRLTNDPALGLHVGRNMAIGHLGVVGFLLQNSPTIGDALSVMLRYAGFIAPAWEFKVERVGELATLTCAEAIPLIPREFVHEVMLSAWDTQTRGLYGGRPLPVRRLEIPFPAPAYAHLYREMFYDVPMKFEESVTKVVFDAALLDARIPFADPATAKLAQRFCAELMPGGTPHEGLIPQVRRLLDASSGPPPTLEEIASMLLTSTRSLRRELRNVRTSYNKLVDESRRARAEEWMETNSLPLEHLATKLGFSHVRSFRRAFKRWTGQLPSERLGRAH